jgi:hypothetical protein
LDVSGLDPKGDSGEGQKNLLLFYLVGYSGSIYPPWVKWDRLAFPKALGGWGLKNIFLFSKALVAKVGWRLISTTILVDHKWIFINISGQITIEDWIWKIEKSHPHCSIIWKAVISSFPVIGEGLAWRIGRGNQVRIGVDPWPGSGQAHILPIEIRDILHEQDIHFISQVSDPGSTSIWKQGWLGPDSFGLVGNQALLCGTNYTMALHSRHI